MTVITRVVDNAQAASSDLNQLIELVEGTAGYAETWLLRCLAGTDFKIRLIDAAGARKFIVQDSTGTTVASIDSSGNLTLTGGISGLGSLVLPTSAAPVQTTEGSMAWDTDDDVLTVGTGAATKRLGLTRGAGSNATATAELVYDTTAAALKVWDGSASQNASGPIALAGSSSAATSTTSTSAVTLVSIVVSIASTSGFQLSVNWRKQALAAQSVGWGFSVNGTTIFEAAAGTQPCSTSTNQAEDGAFIIYVTPRSSANYLWWDGWGSSRVTATGAKGQAASFIVAAPAAVLPFATYTAIGIRAINGTTSNAAETTSIRAIAGAV